MKSKFYNSGRLQVRVYKRNEVFDLFLKLQGKIKKEYCQEACLKWRNLLEQGELGESYNLVCDCTALRGLEYAAKGICLSCFKSFRSSILSVTIVSDNVLFSMLIKFISSLFSCRISVLKLHEYLEEVL